MSTTTRDCALALLAKQPKAFDQGMQPFNPFGTTAWLRHFIDQVVDESTMQAVVIEAEVDGQVVVLMPLSRGPSQPWKLHGLCNYYSSLHTLIHTLAPNRDAAARALVQNLRDQAPRCAVLQLSPLDAQASDTEALRRALDAAGWYTRTYFCFGNWTLSCDGMAFADYIKARDSQLYNTWSRKAKKFKADGSGEARLQLVTRPEDVAAAMDAYDIVYAKSWKNPEPYPTFVRGWAMVCARQGWLRLGIAWVGDVPIAAQFWFTVERHAYIFKLAYDEAFTKWSAGTVLTAHLMQNALDVDRVVEVDYLTGDDPYKKAWMSQRRERIGLLACKLRTPRGLAAALRELAAVTWRRWFPT